MNYIILFHTPVGTFCTKVKNDAEDIIQEKMQYYDEPENFKETLTIETESSNIFISAPILKQSVIEFNFHV